MMGTVILTLAIMLVYREKAADKSLLQFMIIASFVFYVLNVIRLAFFPLPINETYIELLKQEVSCGIAIERRHNLELFDFMKWDNLFHITTVGNFFLLMPLSFYCPFIIKRINWTFIRMTLFGLLISLTIESTQLLYDVVTGYAYRGFNVDDLMMNTLGVIFGFLVFNMIKIAFEAMTKFVRFFYQKAR
ncbi:MAG: VanZ family protein [Turicibacter sp.]|nr:VanZ family protein [Turicibacter sp.]